MKHIEHGSKTYWFPAKTYGVGWGLPCAWQGWVALILYLGGNGLGLYYFSRENRVVSFLALFFVLNLLFIFICWFKGEPIKWRWGKDNRDA